MDNKKKFHKSKTLWFNALIAALTVLSTRVDLLQSYVPESVYLVALMLSAAGNIYLRTVTVQGVGK